MQANQCERDWGYFVILKQGINGVYHHVGEQHLQRDLSEFDFRSNASNTKEVSGERLMYLDTLAVRRAY